MRKAFMIVVLFLLPVSIHAMTPISDDELSDISGQTGVSIFVDITMNIHIETIAWGDSDGIGEGSLYKSAGSSQRGGFIGTADVSITSNPLNPLLLNILKRYSSSGSVCFFPNSAPLNIVNGIVQAR